jgi:hypothetical protein
MKTKINPIALGVFSLSAWMPSMAYACAVCITGAGDPSADAFNWSVLFLMAAPYLVVGSIAGCLFYTYRRAARRNAPTETTEPLVHLAWKQRESER